MVRSPAARLGWTLPPAGLPIKLPTVPVLHRADVRPPPARGLQESQVPLVPSPPPPPLPLPPRRPVEFRQYRRWTPSPYVSQSFPCWSRYPLSTGRAMAFYSRGSFVHSPRDGEKLPPGVIHGGRRLVYEDYSRGSQFATVRWSRVCLGTLRVTRRSECQWSPARSWAHGISL